MVPEEKKLTSQDSEYAVAGVSEITVLTPYMYRQWTAKTCKNEQAIITDTYIH